MAAGSLQNRLFDAKLRLAAPREHQELHWLAETERLDPEALLALQESRSTELVLFAMAHSDYYRERYTRAGIDPRDAADPAWFQSLPVLERADVRENLERLRSSEATAANVQHAVTGGSTGEPLRVLRDARANHRVLGWRLHRWWGVQPGENRALIWRDSLPGFHRNLRHNLLWWPTRTVQMDANHIDEQSTAKFLDGWEQIRPTLLTGYVGALIELAQFVARQGRKIPAPKAVGLTSSPVTPGQKKFLAEVFGAPAYDHYQCIEVPMLAGECSHADGLHVFADARRIEILDDEGRALGPGETGHVVVTDFRNRVLPLIRYRLGDRARWKAGACPCGITLPRLEPVQGRVTDALRFPSGLVIPGEPLTAIFYAWPDAVRQFQLRQEADSSLTLRCVRGSDPDADAILQRVVERLRALVRNEVPVRLELVAAIRHDRGKQRIIVSEVLRDPGAPHSSPAPGSSLR